MDILKRLLLVAGLTGFLLLGGCATPPQPFEYQPDNELKPGPGVLTGKDGAFVIYGRPIPAKDPGETPEEEAGDASSTE